MRRLREQAGFTLVELLVTMTVLTFVLGATVTAFASFTQNETTNREQTDAQDQARMAVSTLARQLRNLASPTEYLPDAVEKAEPNDIVFQTVDALKANGSQNDRNIKRTRYCLGPTANGSATLWVQAQTWVAPNPPPTFPDSTTCPSSAWPSQQAMVHNVTNGVSNEPLFAYNSTDLKAITSVHADLLIDTNPGKPPKATKLSSGVFLRNQNRRPVAALTATYTGTGRRVLLNGSASEDPEGHNLENFEWYLTSAPTNKIADGIVTYWTAPGSGTYTFILKVKDHAGLQATATSGGVVVP